MKTQIVEIPSNVSDMVLTTDMVLSVAQVERVREQWMRMWITPPADGAPRIIVLPPGWKIERLRPREMVEGDL